MHLRLLRRAVPVAACAAVCMLAACTDTYSHDPKVAAGYAAAAGALAVAQAVAASKSEPPSGDWAASGANNIAAQREYALHAINRLRAEHSAPPLSQSAALADFAQRGSEWLSEDHQPQKHLRSDVRCAQCGENQGMANGEPAAPVEVQIDAALKGMMRDEGEGRANLLSPAWRFVGVGIVNPGGAMYLTIDFAEAAF